MEGPYRDLGYGFARLTGVEGVRRSPSRINFVEDALFELLRNARDAGAKNIYVSSSLRARRYRTLTVLDDGHGIPEPYEDLIFEPGVTTRHLAPVSASPTSTFPVSGSGVSLFHIKNVAVRAEVLSTTRPTSIQSTFDTWTLPERASQSGTRSSHSNLPATIRTFIADATSTTPPNIHYGSPATILAALIKNRIIQISSRDSSGWKREGERLGLEVSLRTVQRIGKGEIQPAGVVIWNEERRHDNEVHRKIPSENIGEVKLELGQEEISRIATILGEAARARYLEVGEIELESRPGEIVVRSRVYEPEEEYE